MPITSGDFPQEMKVEMSKLISTNANKRLKEGEWAKFMKKGSMKSQQYVESRQEEVGGPAQLFMEGAVPPEMTIGDGWSKRKHMQQVGIRAGYTRVMKKLNRDKVIARISANVAKSPAQYLDTIAAYYQEYSDTALASIPTVKGIPVIDPIGGDGLTVAHATHTFKSDGVNTYSNLGTLTSLTQDTIQTACTAVLGWKHNAGDLLDIEAKTVIVPRGQMWKAKEIIKSPDKSETANRAINTLHGEIDYRVWRHQIHQTEWTLETTAENDYEMLFAWENDIEDDYDPHTGTSWKILTFAVAHGVNDPRRYYFVKA